MLPASVSQRGASPTGAGCTNVMVLDPDVAAEFKDSAAVNDALRKLFKARLGASR